MKATVENIKEVITAAEVSGDVSELVNDEPLSDQGIDSLDSVSIYLLLEEKFDVIIPDEDLDQIQTIDGMVEYINKKIA